MSGGVNPINWGAHAEKLLSPLYENTKKCSLLNNVEVQAAESQNIYKNIENVKCLTPPDSPTPQG
jgi:hypothetical protein